MLCPYCRREVISGNICPRCGRQMNARYRCPNCGSPINGSFCSNCGTKTGLPAMPQNFGGYSEVPPVWDDSSDKDKWVAFFLCLFLGVLGVHRFYVGKVATGILWIFLTAITSGLWGIAVFVDLIFIVMGKFKDKQGFYLK